MSLRADSSPRASTWSGPWRALWFLSLKPWAEKSMPELYSDSQDCVLKNGVYKKIFKLIWERGRKGRREGREGGRGGRERFVVPLICAFIGSLIYSGRCPDQQSILRSGRMGTMFSARELPGQGENGIKTLFVLICYTATENTDFLKSKFFPKAFFNNYKYTFIYTRN